MREDASIVGTSKAQRIVQALRANGRFIKWPGNQYYATSDVIQATFVDRWERKLCELRIYGGGSVHVLIDGNEYYGEIEDDAAANLLLSYLGIDPYY